MKRIMILAVIVLGLFLAWKKYANRTAENGQAVNKVQAQEGSISETVETTGDVAPLNRVEIRPPISGRIDKFLVDEGSSVKAGDIMAWMSSSDRAAIIDAARAKGPEELRRWEDTYKPTPIVAPISGSIIRRDIVLGQTVDTGSTLFTMADKLIVMANVDEADIGRVRVGMPARITLDAYPDVPVDGKVFKMRFEGKNVSNVITYGVKVEPKNVPDFFRSQMTANVSLIVRTKEKVVLVPAAAISESRSGEKRVFVPGPDGKPLERAVTTGSESGENVEITGGLQAGETVMIMRRRYAPQRAATSPLVLGGSPPRGGEGSRRSRTP